MHDKLKVMACIILSREDDYSADLVYFWLLKNGSLPFRININRPFSIKATKNDYRIIDNKSKKEVEVSKIRSAYCMSGQVFDISQLSASTVREQTLRINKNEQYKFICYLLGQIPSLRLVGQLNYSEFNFNKLTVLKSAQEVNLQVPLNAVVTSKKQLWELKEKWFNIIGKNIDLSLEIFTNDYFSLGQRTIEFTSKMIEELPDEFGITYIQQAIQKEFEIRSIFFADHFYSIAIFPNSSNDIDWRGIHACDNFRMVPYQLPNIIENRLRILCHRLGLNYGAIDIIKATSGEYVFLEVNPYGQYGFVSKIGNYYLEKKIAGYLK